MDTKGSHKKDHTQQVPDRVQQDGLTLSQVIDFLPDATFAIDTQRKVIAWNKAIEELLGVSASSMMGTSDYSLAFYRRERPLLVDLVLGGDRSIESAYASIEHQGDTFMAEGDVETPHGTVRLWGKASPIYDENGGIIGAISSVRDITDRDKARQSLQDSRQMLSQMVDFLPDPTFAIDVHGSVIVWNRAMEELTKVPAPEMIGKGNYEYALPFYGVRRPILIDLTMAEDRTVEEKYAFVERKGDALTAETTAFMRGSKVNLWGKASPIYDAKGQVVGAIESIRDITARIRTEDELRRSEAKIRDIFENVTDFLYVRDLEGRYVESNLAYREHYGFTRDDLKNLTCRDFLFEEDKRHYGTYLARVLSAGSDRGLIRIRARDGSTRYMEYSDSLICDETGKPALIRGSSRDVTERVLAEKCLRESEQRYRLLAQNIRDVIWVVDLNLKYTYVSPSVERLRGYTPEEAMNQPLEDLLLPGSYEKVTRILNHEMDLEKQGNRHDPFWSTTVELQMRCKHGPPIWAEVTASFLRDTNGNPTHLLGVTRDITERKEAEEALRQSEQSLRLLAENIRDIIWVADLSMKYSYVSPSAGRFRGFTAEEIMNHSLEELLTPESCAFAKRLLEEEVGAELAGRRHDPDWSKTIEIEMVNKDGGRVWAEVVVSFIRNRDGEAVSILGVTRDIAERKKAQDSLRQSEERFRALFEHSAEAIVLLEDGRIVACNQAAVDIVRLESKEQLLNRNPAEFSPEFQPDGRRSDEKAREMVQAALDKGSHRFEWVHRKEDGTLFPAEVLLKEIPMGNRRIILTSCRDVTEQKKAEEERAMYETRLVRSQKLEAIGTLAGGIAHDFNNILSAIIGYAELALDDIEKDNPASRCISEVLRGGDRAKDLVSQILTFSRQIQAEKKVVNMGIILKEAMKLLRSSIPSTIGIVQNIARETPPVLADPTQLHQVIMNLCTNAYQSMAERGGTMTVTLGPCDIDEAFAQEHPSMKPGPHAVFTIQDTGCGMDPDTMNRIFEPFFTTREKSRGTGLGLSTVHGIVAAVSGTVVVESRLGQGSTFTVFLPAHAGGAQEEAVSRDATLKGNGEKILIVDDETAILAFTKSMLEPLGYSVSATPSSTEALKMFSSDPYAFDLVITDQTMPQITGMELANRMLSLRSDLPVILVSGFSETVSPEKALQGGIRMYLEKPFTRKAMATAIQQALGSREE